MLLTNGKLEDIEDAVKEEESVKCFLGFRDRNKENTLAKGQNLISLEFLSCGRRELYCFRTTQCLLALGLQSFIGQKCVACVPTWMGFSIRILREPNSAPAGLRKLNPYSAELDLRPYLNV